MLTNGNIRDLLTVQLTDAYAQAHRAFETEKASDTRIGMEVFRRAVFDDDNEAWACIYALHTPQVSAWLKRQVWDVDDADHQDLLAMTFQKFRAQFGPEKYLGAPDLKGVLAYLVACANSCARDWLRKHGRRRQTETPLLDEPDPDTPGHVVAFDAELDRHVERNEAFEIVLQACSDDRERVWVDLFFRHNLSPADIAVVAKDLFQGSVTAVYDTRRNLLERLQRNTQLQKKLR